MKTEKRIHAGWLEFEKCKEKLKDTTIRQLFGKYQYIFSSKKGEISCVEFKDYFHDGKDFWEIYCIKGNLFEDVQRFATLKEATSVCREILK